MICETCHGTGKRRSWAYSEKHGTIGYPVWLPCNDCCGSGITHCCDGLQECADTPPSPQEGIEVSG